MTKYLAILAAVAVGFLAGPAVAMGESGCSWSSATQSASPEPDVDPADEAAQG